jgi:hypothetical protein
VTLKELVPKSNESETNVTDLINVLDIAHVLVKEACLSMLLSSLVDICKPSGGRCVARKSSSIGGPCADSNIFGSSCPNNAWCKNNVCVEKYGTQCQNQEDCRAADSTNTVCMCNATVGNGVATCQAAPESVYSIDSFVQVIDDCLEKVMTLSRS